MQVHLVDGSNEFHRAYHACPRRRSPSGVEIGGVLGFIGMMRSLLADETVTHVAIAFDPGKPTWRHRLWPEYKARTPGANDEDPREQYPLAERAARALGLFVLPFGDWEADDAISSASLRWAWGPNVDRALICSSDKDFAQCVIGNRICLFDRQRRRLTDESGVVDRFGVKPTSIPDYIALVGDTSDGIPGVPGWGPTSAAAVLAEYKHIHEIPEHSGMWEVKVRGATALAANLREYAERSDLWTNLASLRDSVPLTGDLDDLRWRDERADEMEALAVELGAPSVARPRTAGGSR